MRIFISLIALFSLLACSQSDTKGQADKGVSFLDATYDQALAKLGNDDKLLIVDFYSDT